MMAGITETRNSDEVSIFLAMAPPPGLPPAYPLFLTVVRQIWTVQI
jgi:hypothetical protein